MLNQYGSDENLLPFEGNEKKYPTYARIVGVICIALGIIVVSVGIYLYAFTGGTVPFDYGIVIDGGSSHTQVYLYRWLGNKESGTGHVVQEDTCVFESGIASVINPTDILNCSKAVVKSIPSIMKMKTPLYLGATAGMRLLNITNPVETTLRLLTLQYALTELGVNIKDIGIITGLDEGLYSWITVNFLTNSLDPKEKTRPWNGTFGALDLGGASTQFSFAVNSFSQQNYNEITSLKLYGNKYEIYSRSFLCFGIDQAFIRYRSLLVKNLNTTNSIIDPCLPTGNFSVLEALALFGGPCTSTPEFESWLCNSGFKNRTFTFQGSSDYKKCKENVNALLNASFCKEKGFMKCSEKINISDSGVKFMAFSSFSYVASFLNATTVSLNELVDITKRWCKLTWAEIKQHHYNPSDLPHLARYCFGSVYIIQWLTENYGFDETSWKNLIFQDQIGKSDIGWSLGYMINATNAIPEEEYEKPSISVAVFILFVLFSVFTLILGFVFAFIFHKLRKFRIND